MKNTHYGYGCKAIKRMLTFLLVLSIGVCYSHAFASTPDKLSVNVTNGSFYDIVSQIESQTNYLFMYKNAEIDESAKFSIHLSERSLEEVLDDLVSRQNLAYRIEGNHILISQAKATQTSNATKITVKGVVVDEEGLPIIGANIIQKGSTTGTITDMDGNFTLSVDKGSSLRISYIGYVEQVILAKEGQTLRIILKEDKKILDEVIVIGYGTQKKSDMSGSVAAVSGDEIAKIPTTSTGAALQGLAPGLSVNMDSGSPGSNPELMVRGVTSWGSSNAPLVIIDGTPGSIAYLNPEDIKSMTVLKDAAMASIYGSRAAAGVILIETNRGAKQEPKIEVSGHIGFETLPKRINVCNSEQYITVNKWALESAGIPKNRWPKYIAAYDQDPSQFADTDWQDEFYRNGLTQKMNVGYKAGGENMNLAISGFYTTTRGLIVGTSSDQVGFRVNSDVKRGRFKIGESFSYGNRSNRPQANTGFPTMYQATNIQPLIHVYDENNEGGFGGAIPGMGMTDAANPVAFNKLVDAKNANDYFSASGYISYEPIDNLIFKFQASRNLSIGHSKTFTPTYYVGASSVNTIASLSEFRDRGTEDLVQLTGNYNVRISDKHDLSAMLGVSEEENRYKDLSAGASKFENNILRYLVHGQDNFSVGGGFNRNALRSFFGRLSYNYDYRYLFTFSSRYDGSSRFGEGNEWGFFPSASLGWNIANEKFWAQYKENVSAFKLRLSYGALGNQSIGNYMFIPTLSYNSSSLNYPFNGQDIDLGYAIQGLASTRIKWETTYYQNIGVDLGLWNNKLEFTFDAYIKNTKDMLSTKNISPSTGYGSLIVNDGKLRTTGFEFQTIYHGVSGDFNYDLNLNLSHYRSVLKSMADEGYMYENGPARTYVGGEIGEFWVTKTDGIFQTQEEVDSWNKEHGFEDNSGTWIPLQPNAKPGDIRFIDQNGDGKLDSNDKVKMGSGNPKLVLGFNTTLSYKNFDLVANFYGHFGVKRYNGMKRQILKMDGNFNYGKDALNSWRPDNKKTSIPRAVIGDPNGNTRVSDRYVETGDFLRLNNLQIGYNLPKEVCHKLNIDNLRFFLGGARLFTITSYSGYDPATGSGAGSMGVDGAVYPLSRSFTLGFNLGF